MFVHKFGHKTQIDPFIFYKVNDSTDKIKI